jgi:glycolate oxidase iron-sulfur subunit
MSVKNYPRERLLGVLPDDDVLAQCIHCGMCLATCPTYELTKLERSSPRGRIRMIKAVARGEMEMSQAFADEMDFCLDCQACETACPAGVKYGSMVEAARVEVDNAGFGSPVGRMIKKFALQYILTSPARLKFISRLLYFYQRLLQKPLHSSGLFKLIAPKLAEIDKLAPTVSKVFSDKVIPEVVKPEGEARYKTAFLSGCLMNVMFADINTDTIDVLKGTGCQIYTPKDQVCCGSMHAHNGDFDTAKKLAKKNLDIFSRYNFDYMISNSAGCGAFMKEYAHVFRDDPEYSEKAIIFSKKVKDITEFLVDIREDVKFGNLNENITYHDACHLAHTQKIVSEPRQVLASIPGLNHIPLEESTWCCGSAGTYNILQYDTSMKILERKMENIRKTGADIVLTGNPGCYQQLKYGTKKFHVDIKVEHPVTLFKKALLNSKQ